MNKEQACFFWNGQMSDYELMYLKSFVSSGFDVQVYSYDVFDVPTGVRLLDARDILDHDQLYRFSYGDKLKCVTCFSDIFRIEMIHKRPDVWWFDLDCFCLKPSEEFTLLREQKSLVLGLHYEPAHNSGCNVNNAVIHLSDENIRNTLYNNMYRMIDHHDGQFEKWGDIGPHFLEDQVIKLKLKPDLCPYNFFYPVAWWDVEMFFDRDKTNHVMKACEQSYLVHVCNNEIVSRGLKTDPPSGSYLHHLFNKISN